MSRTPTPADWRLTAYWVAATLDFFGGMVAWSYQHVPLAKNQWVNFHSFAYIVIILGTIEAVAVWVVKGKGLSK